MQSRTNLRKNKFILGELEYHNEQNYKDRLEFDNENFKGQIKKEIYLPKRVLKVVQITDNLVVLTHYENYLTILNLYDNSTQMHESSPGQYSVLKFDDNTFLTGNDNGEIQIWQIQPTIQIKKTIKAHKHQSGEAGIFGLSKINSYTFVSSGHDSEVNLWNINTGKQISSLKGHQSRIWPQNILSFNQGKMIVTGDKQGILKVWNPRKQKCLYHHDLLRPILCQLKLDDQSIIVASENDINIIDINRLKVLKSKDQIHDNYISEIKLVNNKNNKNSKLLFSAGRDYKIKVWEINAEQKNRICIDFVKSLNIMNQYNFSICFLNSHSLMINNSASLDVIDNIEQNNYDETEVAQEQASPLNISKYENCVQIIQ